MIATADKIVTLNCEECGKAFRRYAVFKARFCSKECDCESRKKATLAKRTCKCGKPVTTRLRPDGKGSTQVAYNKTCGSAECKANQPSQTTQLHEANKRLVILSYGGACIECSQPIYRKTITQCCSNECYDRVRRRLKKTRHRMAVKGSTPNIRQQVFERDGYQCWLCGGATNPDGHYLDADYPTEDHVVPVSKGGSHTLDNVRCACRICNERKQATLPEVMATIP